MANLYHCESAKKFWKQRIDCSHRLQTFPGLQNSSFLCLELPYRFIGFSNGACASRTRLWSSTNSILRLIVAKTTSPRGSRESLTWLLRVSESWESARTWSPSFPLQDDGEPNLCPNSESRGGFAFGVMAPEMDIKQDLHIAEAALKNGFLATKSSVEAECDRFLEDLNC